VIHWDLILGTEEVCEELQRLYDQMSLSFLAEHLGVSPAALRNQLKKCGIKLRPRGGAHHKVPREDLPNNLSDMSPQQIVKLTGYSPSYARKLKFRLRRERELRKSVQTQTERSPDKTNSSNS